MYEGLVQPIAILKDSGSHEDVVAAAALASVGAWLRTGDLPEWNQWLAGPFTKSVRRGNRVRLSAIENDALFRVRVREAWALGFAPMTYEDFPKQLSKMQVSGSDFERSGEWETSRHGPILTINLGLEMSTGKTAAQAAHGLFMWALSRPEEERNEWFKAGMPLSISEVSQEAFDELRSSAKMVVTDAGFTEIEPGSATVLVS